MASSVFFRFKSSKEPSRVTFDGTGISVFELKKEIITLSGLGNGLDFELILSSSDGDREYDDDTEIVLRSTTVIAKRLPATRTGKGGASRYVSGKPPVNARISKRTEPAGSRGGPSAHSHAGGAVNATMADAQSEAERMEAVLQMGAEQWKRQQQDMANAAPVHRPGAKSRPPKIPNRPPPPYYTCHRCEKKGHWLQECPENGNPAFDDMRRVKKTMGIPRSQLKVIEKKPAITDDGKVEDARPPPGVMVDADGNWVVAKPDQTAWDKYQEKATKSAAAKEEADRGSEELQRKGLACPLDKRLFIEPAKMPCCETVYCKQCITDALLDSGLECPNCGKEGVPFDDLKPDAAMTDKLEEYERARRITAIESAEAGAQDFTTAEAEQTQPSRPNDQLLESESSTDRPIQKESPQHRSGTQLKKRRAESDAKERRAKSPKPGSQQQVASIVNGKEAKGSAKGQKFPDELAFLNQAPFANPAMTAATNGLLSMPTGMSSMGMWNPMMMPYVPARGQWGNMAGFGQNGPTGPGMNYGPQEAQSMEHQTANAPPKGPSHRPTAKTSGPSPSKGEDSAYFRQPVNPQRQGRRAVSRPADFRDI